MTPEKSDRGQQRLRRVLCVELSLGECRLAEKESHYVRDVLRLAAGDALQLFDGRGRTARAKIVRCDKIGVCVDVLSMADEPAPSFALTVALATPKGQRSDWVVEKLTELGVAQIRWIDFARSVVQPRDKTNRLLRWQRLAEAAARQAGRDKIPEIAAPAPFVSLMQTSAKRLFVADARADQPLGQIDLGDSTSAIVVIGPEGGLTQTELDALQSAGYQRVALAPFVLRTETAALVAAAQLMGRMQGNRLLG